jgi:hypothetical protein
MFDMVVNILSLIPDFVAKLNDFVLVNFNGTEVTLLGFMGALIVVGVMIRVFMPKP